VTDFWDSDIAAMMYRHTDIGRRPRRQHLRAP